jgi:hypothetical protein
MLGARISPFDPKETSASGSCFGLSKPHSLCNFRPSVKAGIMLGSFHRPLVREGVTGLTSIS